MFYTSYIDKRRINFILSIMMRLCSKASVEWTYDLFGSCRESQMNKLRLKITYRQLLKLRQHFVVNSIDKHINS